MVKKNEHVLLLYEAIKIVSIYVSYKFLEWKFKNVLMLKFKKMNV